MNKSEIVDKVIVQLLDGQVTAAVETMMKGRKTKPCEVAVLSSLVTESLMNSKEHQALKFFTSKLEFFHKNNVHY